jgi:tripartite-type tricarboxylate transporter receptor subunit TctC
MPRNPLLPSLCGVVLLAAGALAAAQSWPPRELRFVMTTSPGTGADMQFRTLGPAIAAGIGAIARFDNLPGAGGEIALREALRVEDDCSTLLTVTLQTLAFTNALRGATDVAEEFVFLGSFVSQPTLLTIRADAPWRDANAFFATARARPLTITNASIQSAWGLAMFQLRDAGYQVEPVPMSGGDEQAALLGGFVDAAMFTSATVASLGDRVRTLGAFLTAEGAAVAGQVSIPAALGLDLPDVVSQRSLMVRRGCTTRYPERYAALERAFDAARSDPAFVESAATLGFGDDLIASDGESDLARYLTLEAGVQERRDLFR